MFKPVSPAGEIPTWTSTVIAAAYAVDVPPATPVKAVPSAAATITSSIERPIALAQAVEYGPVGSINIRTRSSESMRSAQS